MYYSDPKFWFSSEGRVNRRPYFFGGCAVAVFTEGFKLVPGIYKLLALPFVLVAIYCGVVLGIKRCHDRGKTGWFILVNLVPLLFLWPMIELTFFKGDDGPNQYGDDPLQAPAA
jgi:uncharacterized membrane protein YhaH (DUF805 family)